MGLPSSSDGDGGVENKGIEGVAPPPAKQPLADLRLNTVPPPYMHATYSVAQAFQR